MLLPLILNLATVPAPAPAPAPSPALGVPRWSAIIKGRLHVGSRREMEAALRAAAQADAQKAADEVEPLASNREVRKAARLAAKELVSDAVVFDAPLFDLLGLSRANELQARQQAEQVREMNRIYMREFEEAMLARAKQTALEDREDMEDLAEILELL